MINVKLGEVAQLLKNQLSTRDQTSRKGKNKIGHRTTDNNNPNTYFIHKVSNKGAYIKKENLWLNLYRKLSA